MGAVVTAAGAAAADGEVVTALGAVVTAVVAVVTADGEVVAAADADAGSHVKNLWLSSEHESVKVVAIPDGVGTPRQA